MNKNILIIAVIAILVLAGGVGLSLSKRSTQSSQEKQNSSQEKKQSSLTSLEELIGMGKSQMCTYETSNVDTGTTKGTVYLSGKKMRTEYTLTGTDNKTITGSMINDGTYAYMWTSEVKQGFKMAVTEDLQKETEKFKTQQEKYLDPKTKIDFRCQGWIVDGGKFTPPADIEFMDFSKQMQQSVTSAPGNEGAPDQKTQQCMACNYLQGEQQAQCKQSLGCQ